MLSYRHAFHAGNHADVLKHTVQIALLRYLNQKDKAYWYVDTHAGAGMYSLVEGYATRLAEFADGVGRLWDRSDLPPALADYLEQVKSFNPDGKLTLYPGSPACAMRVLRPQDHARLYELHSSDGPLLQQAMQPWRRAVQIDQGDGFAGLKAVLPPPPRRALVLIDPPYEDKGDYKRVVDGLREGLKRFATGTYAVWYPLLQRAESQGLADQLKKLPAKGWLEATLTVQTPSADGFGMHGSGMFILNPPYNLKDTLAEVMPYLVRHLGRDNGARFVLQAHENAV